MAQRIYLVPVSDHALQLFERCVASEDDLTVLIGEARTRTMHHQRVSRISRRNAKRLNEQAFEKVGRIDDYYLWVALRPYLITVATPGECLRAISSVKDCKTDEQIQQFFDEQLGGLSPELVDEMEEGELVEEDGWEPLATDLSRLREMRTSLLKGTSYTFEALRQETWDGGTTVVTDDIEEVQLQGEELSEAYGNLVGYTLARFCALGEPSWWLGNNFWPGLMLTANLGFWSFITRRTERELRNELAASAASPADILERVATPGFEAGMPLICEGYSSGLYFSPESAETLARSIEMSGSGWMKLAQAVTGYPSEAVAQLLQMALEAFTFSAQEGAGVMEADEPVGAYGYR